MLTAATRAGHMQGNPARGTRLGRSMPQEMVLITAAEFEAIHAQLPDYAKPLARFLVGTGMRWGEATALTWADVNLTVRPATARVMKAWKRGVNGSPELDFTKTRKSIRTVSLPPQVVAAMGAPGRPGDLIFPGPGGIGQQAWTKRFHRLAWYPAVEASGVGKRPRVHDLRHAQSSWLIAEGVPLPWIQQRLGHEKITTTVDTYGHLTPEAHEQMALVMQQVFERAQPAALPAGRSEDVV
jgi:integrase